MQQASICNLHEELAAYRAASMDEDAQIAELERLLGLLQAVKHVRLGTF